MTILLCVATAFEAKACRKAVKDHPEFEILQTGMGLEKATQKLTARLAKEPLPKTIISTGFAGCRTTQKEVGTWVLGSSVVAAGKQPIPIKTRLKLPAQRADYLSLDKLKAPHHLELDVVDMESYALASIAEKHQIPFEIFRIISDNADFPIPACIIHFASAHLSIRWPVKIQLTFAGLLQLLIHPVVLCRYFFRCFALNRALALGINSIATIKR